MALVLPRAEAGVLAALVAVAADPTTLDFMAAEAELLLLTVEHRYLVPE
jgi:hypothetical protein